ncbi:MAG: hypothetical protein HY897_15020 [Deltaproteobacteria bacterium]|nr:hypothetical protein [Deltaproteobacteria bacterium]
MTPQHRSRRAVALSTVVLAALCGSHANAQMKKQLAVVPFKAGSEIRQMAELCNISAREETSRNPAVLVVDNAEIAARLDLEGKNVAGCSDDAECIIANGDSLGIDGVLYGSLSREADLVSITMKLYLIRERREDRTFAAKLAGEPPDIAALVARAATALVTGAPLPEVSAAQPPPPPPDRVLTAAPVGPEVSQPPSTIQQETPAPAGKGRLWTWVALGCEGAFLATGITFHVLAYKTEGDIKAGGQAREDLDGMISTGNTQVLLSRIFYGLAVGAIGATVFLYWWEGEPAAKDGSTSKLFEGIEPVAGLDAAGGGFVGLGGKF